MVHIPTHDLLSNGNLILIVILMVCPFDYTAVAVSAKVGYP